MQNQKMKHVGQLALCASAAALLLLLDIGLRVRQQHLSAFTKQFAVVPLYTNGTSGIEIVDRAINRPLWGQWKFAGGVSDNFFVQGKLVLSVASVKEGRSLTELYFYGKDGKLSSLWRAREDGTFYGRMFFDESGFRSEAWLNESWHSVEKRTNGLETNAGVVLDGKWHRLVYTNGVTTIEK
jgi:hypothetical protein